MRDEKSVKLAGRCDATVLITGPTGSGKTTLAKQIHQNGLRQSGRYVAVNLATMHEGTLESELFGHEKGAFTGADRFREGLLELADGGTVFLDEISELNPKLQSRLLEFIQSKTLRKVGSNVSKKIDVRVIAASN